MERKQKETANGNGECHAAVFYSLTDRHMHVCIWISNSTTGVVGIHFSVSTILLHYDTSTTFQVFI
jgi:hypothetical protein